MRSGGRRRRADQNHLLGPRRSHLLDQAAKRVGPVAESVRLALPGPLARKGHEVRIGHDRHAQRRAQRVDDLIAARPRQVDCLGLAAIWGGGFPGDARSEKRLSMGRREQSEHNVGPDVEIVGNEQELAKPRLPQVLGEQLGVAARHLGVGRQRERRRAANQIPQRNADSHLCLRGAQRRGCKPGPAHARPAPGAASQREPASHDERPDGGDEEEDNDARHERRECSGGEGLFEEPRGSRRQGDAGGAEAREVQQQPADVHRYRCQEETDRKQQGGHGTGEQPAGDAQRSAPSVEHGRLLAAPEAVFVPQLCAAVDRGKKRGRGTHAAARDEIHPHARLVQRAQHAGMVRAGGSGACEHQSRATPRRILRRAHSASSCMVESFVISNVRAPLGVTTFTSSPSSLLRSARPIGEAVEIQPLAASASSGITSW